MNEKKLMAVLHFEKELLAFTRLLTSLQLSEFDIILIS